MRPMIDWVLLAHNALIRERHGRELDCGVHLTIRSFLRRNPRAVPGSVPTELSQTTLQPSIPPRQDQTRVRQTVLEMQTPALARPVHDTGAGRTWRRKRRRPRR